MSSLEELLLIQRRRAVARRRHTTLRIRARALTGARARRALDLSNAEHLLARHRAENPGHQHKANNQHQRIHQEIAHKTSKRPCIGRGKERRACPETFH